MKHEAANIAAAYLCERRGNDIPPGIARAFERLPPSTAGPRAGTHPPRPGTYRTRGAADIGPGADARPIQIWPTPHTVVEPNRSSSRNLPTDYYRAARPVRVFDYCI